MSRGKQNRRPDKNTRGLFGLTAPSSGGSGGRGKGGGGGGSKGSKPNSATTAAGSRGGEILAPPSMKKGPGSGSATSKKNNDGDLFTRKDPYRRPRNFPPF